MAGQLGNKRVTTQNVSVVSIDSNEGLILVKGSVPGSKGGFVYIKDAIKSKLPEGLPYPAGLLEKNKIVSESINKQENNDKDSLIDENSNGEISKSDNSKENKEKWKLI